MAFDYNNLVEMTTIADSAGALLTNGASETSYVRLINIFNSSTAGTETVKMYLVPAATSGAAGTAAATNQIYEEAIPSKGTRIIAYDVPGLMMENENDTLQAVTDTASKVTFTATGGQE